MDKLINYNKGLTYRNSIENFINQKYKLNTIKETEAETKSSPLLQSLTNNKRNKFFCNKFSIVYIKK